MITNLIVVVPLLLKHPIRESIKQVEAFVHRFSQHLELPEHSFVCDMPPVGILHSGLDSQQDTAQPWQVLLHTHMLPVASVNDEGYRSTEEISENC